MNKSGNNGVHRWFARFAVISLLASSVLLGATAASQAAPAAAPVPTEAVPAGHTPVPVSRQASPNDPIRPLLCSGHAVEYGDWANADPSATGIARIELRDCQPVTVCDGSTCRIVHDAGWTTHVFGKCSPTNCDWGWSRAEFRLSSGQIYGFYDQGFAKRYVYAKMSQYRPGQLWVYWRTDFVDPNRPDYEVQEWFVRA